VIERSSRDRRGVSEIFATSAPGRRTSPAALPSSASRRRVPGRPWGKPPA